MRKIPFDQVVVQVKKLCIDANYYLDEEVIGTIKERIEHEHSIIGKKILSQILDNASIARDDHVPLCQDTGLAIFFLEMGDLIRVEGGSVYEAIQEGVRQGYRDGYLRKSVVDDPLERKNTMDNTPAIIHTTIIEGDFIRLIFIPKGAGSENMSTLKMLSPSEGWPGIKSFVLQTVSSAGANPCPPIVVGIGIGGSFEFCALMAKKALTRPLHHVPHNPVWAAREVELLEEINKLGIGPAGLGGNTTALRVAVEVYPCHIASLPVAVNIGCHAHRHGEIII
ncbi:MAG: fumarate hydratase [bacterium]